MNGRGLSGIIERVIKNNIFYHIFYHKEIIRSKLLIYCGLVIVSVGVAGLPSVILCGVNLKEKALHSLRSFTGFCFSFAYESKLSTLRKTKPCSAFGGRAFSFVGVAGFEPATLWSQTRCANRAALHPEKLISHIKRTKPDALIPIRQPADSWILVPLQRNWTGLPALLTSVSSATPRKLFFSTYLIRLSLFFIPFTFRSSFTASDLVSNSFHHLISQGKYAFVDLFLPELCLSNLL